MANRIRKMLEDANIKLAGVASDVLGVSGRAMLEAIVAGEDDPERLADLAVRRLRGKIPQLRLALRGRVTEHHRFLLGQLLRHLDLLDELIGQLSARIERMTAPDAEAMGLLATIPVVKQRTAEVLLAEVGPTVDSFPTAAQFASWAGMYPGNNESAGKRRTGRTRQGNWWLRQPLVQAAWAALRAKGTYLAARYRRVCRRRGPKRAMLAVGHMLLVIVYQVLKRRAPYRELGGTSTTGWSQSGCPDNWSAGCNSSDTRLPWWPRTTRTPRIIQAPASRGNLQSSSAPISIGPKIGE